MALNKRSWFFIFPLSVFAVLIFLSAVFYHERLLVDSGYYLMRVINSRLPWVEHQRFILILSQVLPVIGVNLVVPLKTVLLLYSLNHVLFPLLIFFFSFFIFRNQFSGIMLILLQVAGLVTGFLVPMFELYYAAALLVLFASVLYSGSLNKYHYLLLIVIAFFVTSSHPVGMALLIMVIVFHLSVNGLKYLKFYAFIGSVILGFLLLKYLHASSYESGKANSIVQEFISGKYNLSFLVQLSGFLFQYYWALIIMALGMIIQMIRQKKFKIMAIYLISIVVFIILSALNTGNFEWSRYNEQVWFPLGFVVLFPLMTGLFSEVKQFTSTILLFVLLVFTAYRLLLIYENAAIYRQRTAQLSNLTRYVQATGVDKFVVDELNLAEPLTPGANWSYPIESMFFSAETGPEHTVTICTLEDYTFQDLYMELTDSSYVFWRINTAPDGSLNPHYFTLHSNAYVMLNNDSAPELISDSIKQQVLLKQEVDKSMTFAAGEWARVWSVIVNRSPSVLFSGRKSGFFMTYEWKGVTTETALNTPLRVDIDKKFRQDVIIRTPEIPGNYELILLMKSPSGQVISQSRAEKYLIKQKSLIGF